METNNESRQLVGFDFRDWTGKLSNDFFTFLEGVCNCGFFFRIFRELGNFLEGIQSGVRVRRVNKLIFSNWETLWKLFRVFYTKLAKKSPFLIMIIEKNALPNAFTSLKSILIGRIDGGWLNCFHLLNKSSFSSSFSFSNFFSLLGDLIKFLEILELLLFVLAIEFSFLSEYF